jgi:catechol 2,3-dioxygenase-like lactoylglutathione lyase family enzyme
MALAWKLSLLGMLVLPLSTMAPPQRPQIYGVALVRIRVSDLAASRHFYHDTLGLYPLTGGCFSPIGAVTCYHLNFSQQLETFSDPKSKDTNALETLGLQVHDATQMRSYLLAQGIKCGRVAQSNSGDKFFEVFDPGNHRILFLAAGGKAGSLSGYREDTYLIHTGFVVKDRAATDHFYKDILGFRPYWHGGMKDDKDDWVAMQVPDGTDWLEYMLNISPNADHHTLGVMNHIALGVSDIHATEKQLIANGWKPTEEPKLGRDGKWQLNVYDPDDTRVEFMEFKPKEAPCCSAFTGPHPGPK